MPRANRYVFGQLAPTSYEMGSDLSTVLMFKQYVNYLAILQS